MDEYSEIDKNLLDLIAKNWGSYCPSCGAQKDLDKLKIIRKMGSATQILSECEQCGMKTIITAFPNLGMHINQIRTDLNTSEIERFTSPVTSEDYLDFYNKVKKVQNTNDLINMINKV